VLIVIFLKIKLPSTINYEEGLSNVAQKCTASNSAIFYAITLLLSFLIEVFSLNFSYSCISIQTFTVFYSPNLASLSPKTILFYAVVKIFYDNNKFIDIYVFMHFLHSKKHSVRKILFLKAKFNLCRSNR